MSLRAQFSRLSLCICLIDMRLQGSCKGLRRLQELSVLTGFGRQDTFHAVVYDLGELAPS